MFDNPERHWDADIAALELSDLEKNGLQMYRTYTRRFVEAREKNFALKLDNEPPDCSELNQVMALITKEDIRFVPVIICAFADDELKRMFKRFLREGIPGGKKAMLGSFGPLSSFCARIQFAFAFDMIHPMF